MRKQRCIDTQEAGIGSSSAADTQPRAVSGAAGQALALAPGYD
jgi:hypothetical protein